MTPNFDNLYQQMLTRILLHGDLCKNRTGVQTLSLFGESFSWDMRNGFPLLGLRKLGMKMPALELQWMIHGGHTTKFLHDNGCHIWDKWQNILAEREPGVWPEGDLGRIYGAQWRNFGKIDGTDQLKLVYDLITKDPYSRRIIMSLWSPNELDEMALPPCHVMFQFGVKDGGLNLLATQRSMDFPVGGPHDIAQFALFLHLMAHVTGYEPRKLMVSVGDLHIYENQFEAANIMRDRACTPTPSLSLRHLGTGFDQLLGFSPEYCELSGYVPHEAIKIPVTA